MYCFNIAVVAYPGLPSAIAVLDGKHYNNLRARLHSLANRVNTRVTVAGLSVSLTTFAIFAFEEPILTPGQSIFFLTLCVLNDFPQK